MRYFAVTPQTTKMSSFDTHHGRRRVSKIASTVRTQAIILDRTALAALVSPLPNKHGRVFEDEMT